MMMILMIDVEAGKEDLFNRIHDKLSKMKSSIQSDDVKMLYLATCFTHSDISLMIDVNNPDVLPSTIINPLLKMDGVWDIQIIPLLDPQFFKIPSYIEKNNYEHFTITLDVKSENTETVFNYLREFAATEEAAISFLSYSFYSFDNDIIISLLARDIRDAGKFVKEKIRTIDGVIDTFLWQVDKWRFVVSHFEWLNYINFHRLDDLLESELLDDTYICAC
jgi:DNA-binding Lrp family transcriptional regulator